MKAKLAERLFSLALVAMLVALGCNALFSYRNARKLIESEKLVSHTYEVKGAIDEVLLAAVDAETGQRGYLLSRQEEFLAPFKQAVARVDDKLRRAVELTADNPPQQACLRELAGLVTGRMQAFSAGVAAREAGGPRVLEALQRDKDGMDAIRRVAGEVMAVEDRLLEERGADTEYRLLVTNGTFVVATLMAMATVGTGYYLLRRGAVARSAAAGQLAELAADNRRILQSTGEGIYGINTDGACTFLNRAGGQLLGYTPEAVLGKDIHVLVHHTKPDGSPYPVEECPVYKVLKSGQGGRVDDEFFYRADGSRFPTEYSSYPIIKDGALTGAVVTFSDVTARKEAEERLRAQEQQFRTMVDSIAQLAWIAEANGDIHWYNRRWYEYTGTTVEQMDGWGWKTVHHPDTVARVVEKFTHALKTGQDWEDTFPLRGKDGEYRHFLSRASPIRDFSGRIVRWFGTNTDVEDQRRITEELAASKRAAEDANQAKSAFLANMSHELRTPLNAVIMYSELLQEEAADIGQGDAFGPDLDRIRNAGKHLLSLVNGVLDLSKIEAGKMELDLETFDFPTAIAEVVDTIRPLVAKKGNTLTVDCPPGVGAVHADTTKVRQVLFNLLSNANKFTEAGSLTLTVRRVSDPAGDRLSLTVADTGIGMTDEQISRLFQPFTQADASTTRKYGGTGLGLTISKRFAEMMGGTITVTSVLGAGTTFTADFPTRVSAVETQPARKTGLLVPPDAPTMLVIDDDAGVREFMTRALSSQGVRPLLAGDGEEGLRLARLHHPAVVFLDVIMPRLDGWAVLAALKGDPAFKDTPVVMMTVVGDQDMGYMLGAADYLQKPIDREQLATALAKFKPAPGGRVLVVDDDPATREVLRRALVRDGWLVDEAENGRQALDRVTAGVPALVLLDLLMPEMTGFEFVAELRKNPAWGGIPVVVLSSKDLTPDERQMLAGNVERVVQKGAYSRDALMAEVNKVVAAYGGRTVTATKEG